MNEIPITRRELLTLVVCLSLAVLPHTGLLGPWIIGFYLLLAGFRVLALYHPSLLPGRWLLLLLTLAGLANVLAHHPILLTRDAGVALLVSMIGLKLLETRKRRDLIVSVFLGYFLIVSQFLYQQSAALALYLLGVLVGLTAILVDSSRAHPSSDPLEPLRHSALLLVQAAPVMLVLFVLFPRLSAPLWSLELDSETAFTGLADRLAPGSVSRLVQSRAVVFRVRFEGPAPPAEQRYWRGPVFWHSDGHSWQSRPDHRAPEESQAAALTLLGQPVDYTIDLEPTGQRWLFALDLPVNLPVNARRTADFQVLANTPLRQRSRYRLRSYLEYRTGPLSADARRRALQLPDNVSPRMEALAQRWRGDGRSPAAAVLRALSYFRTQPFVYTLTPPALGVNPVDQFLFETRRGFCEHYATAFTLMMRLVGLPARVVTGYQGGEFNPHGDYFILRQSDAHAWSEVWISERGWVRIDPTAAVAPERIEHPIDQQAGALGAPVRFRLQQGGAVGELLHQAGLAFDALNMGWRRWVLKYDERRQHDLLSRLGLGFVKGYGLAAATVAATLAVLLLIAAGLWRRTNLALDPVQRSYRRFCRRLRRLGLPPRHPWEGALDYARRLRDLRPDLAAIVQDVTKRYLALRYGAGSAQGKRDLKLLNERIRQL